MRRLAILVLVSCAACTSGAAGPGARVAPGTQPSTTLGQLRALIGNAACTGSAQCRTVAVGARACGGPEMYLPWSTAQTRPDALQSLAARYQAERLAELQASGAVSDCRFTADPGAVCRAGSCQLGAAVRQAR